MISVVGRLNNKLIHRFREQSLCHSDLEFHVHEIDSASGATDEEDLHDGVVEGDEAGEEVQVPRHEHHQEQDLRLAGYSCTAPGLPDLEEQQNYGEKVRQVAKQTKDIHLVLV